MHGHLNVKYPSTLTGNKHIWHFKAKQLTPRAHTTCMLPRVQHFIPNRYQMSGSFVFKAPDFRFLKKEYKFTFLHNKYITAQ